MKLYIVHCGFYDHCLQGGVYELHANFAVVASSFEEARAQVKILPEYKERKMHVDGLQEIEAVQGFHVELRPDAKLAGRTLVTSYRDRPRPPKRHPNEPVNAELF